MAQVSERDSRVVLPERYAAGWREPFEAAIRQRLSPGTTVLDIGAGRHPSVPAAERPPGVHWVGLDVSGAELRSSPAGSYDQIVVADVAGSIDGFDETIDLAVSWQVLEHVRPLDRALANIYASLGPRGELVSLFSGAWSAFAIANRALPERLASALVGRVMRRRGGDYPVFPAYYDQCYATALRRLFSHWSDVTISPYYRGAVYFHFSATLQRAYLAYEDAVERRGFANMATHYYVVAQK